MALLQCGILQVVLPERRRGFVCCASSADAFAQPQEFPVNVKKKVRRIAGVDQSVLLDPWLLADANSRFAEYNGVQVHYKISQTARAENAAGVPAILLHGFGASLFSWQRVLEPLSRILAAAAVAFDRPGFGLTSRIVPNVSAENPYTLQFSAAIAVAFIDFLKAEKAIIIGHSAGCIVAADAYFKAPERIAAIVMIAPAIVAPLTNFKRRDKNNKDQTTTPKPVENAEDRPSSWLGKFIKFMSALFTRLQIVVTNLFTRFVNCTEPLKEIAVAFFCKIVTAALRSRAALWLVQRIMDRYGEKVVRYAWFNPEKADESVIQGYTKPLGCRNWDRALLEYVIALVASRNEKNLSAKLEEISCPVLVITGDTDRMVPAWNAERLARVFQRSKFHLIKQCGHLPHEEKPEEVVTAINEFLSELKTTEAKLNQA